MNLEMLKKYNSLRTNILYDFIHSPLFEMTSEEISFFLLHWQQTHCVFTSYLNRKTKPFDNGSESMDPNNLILEETRAYSENRLLTNLSGNEKWLEGKSYMYYVDEGLNLLSVREFYYIEKGKYYLGYDLDEDLIGVMPYLKDQELFEKYNEELKAYFKFRYDTYNLSLLGEYYAVPFGIHETKLLQYKKTGKLEFEYPREVFKYPVKEWFDEMFIDHFHKDTKIINIRGTNGSGKTTMVNGLYLSSNDKETVAIKLTNRKGQSHDRFFDVLNDRHVILLGGYKSNYGTKGVDRMDDVTEIIQGLMYVVNHYPGWTIIMESATVSTSFWSYATLFSLLKKAGVEIIVVHLLMHDWEFVVNNVRNRTSRKEGAKEPKWDEIKDKRFIFYKNHFRFTSILGKSFIVYPDDYTRDTMNKLMEKILCLK